MVNINIPSKREIKALVKEQSEVLEIKITKQLYTMINKLRGRIVDLEKVIEFQNEKLNRKNR